MPHILIAPNAFKGSLDAIAAAAAIADGLHASRLQCTLETFPIGDGGDGTGRALVRALDGRSLMFEVTDPLGRAVQAPLGLVDADSTAVIEMADASGLRLLQLQERDPWRTSTYGTGQLIRHALDLKVTRILLGVGGSATVDGGIGILHALGARFLDRDGRLLKAQPSSLPELQSIDVSGLDPRLPEVAIEILCDVRNPLVGERGAAAIFGPQKGATAPQIALLDAALAHFAAVMAAQGSGHLQDVDYGGAAGGVAAGLVGVLGARTVEGIDFFLERTHFAASLARAHLVITGEGSIDSQTLEGKAPYGVAQRARAAGVPVVAMAGVIPLMPHAGLDATFDILSAIGAGPADLETAMRTTAHDLRRRAWELGNTLHVGGMLNRDRPRAAQPVAPPGQSAGST